MPTQERRPEQAKDRGGRRKGSKDRPQMRGAQRTNRHDCVLGPQDNAAIIDELRRFQPICSIAAKLNVARHTLEHYIHRTPELEQELQDRDESMIDLTERSIFDASLGTLPRGPQGGIAGTAANAVPRASPARRPISL